MFVLVSTTSSIYTSLQSSESLHILTCFMDYSFSTFLENTHTQVMISIDWTMLPEWKNVSDIGNVEIRDLWEKKDVGM